MKKFFNLIFAFLKKEALWVKDSHAEVVDNYNLWVVKSKIDNLNEDLKWEFDPFNRRDIIVELALYSEAHNTILKRINEREARSEAERSQKVVAH